MNKKVLMLIGIVSTLMIGGCIDLTNANEEQNNQDTNEQEDETGGENPYLVSINDYTGEEYGYYATPEADEVIEEKREDVEAAVKNFFQEKYKTEVEVKKITSARNAATVFVESLGEVKFYTYAIVPLNIGEKEVLADEVFSEEGQVERAIQSGVYALIYEEELKKLDDYLNAFVEENPVVSMRKEASESIIGAGYGTPYYFISTSKHTFENVNNQYIENPSWSDEDWREEYSTYKVDPSHVTIPIQLYMEEDVEPDQAILNQIVTDIEEMEGLPTAEYAVILNDNFIDGVTGVGTKDNTLERGFPDMIIKE